MLPPTPLLRPSPLELSDVFAGTFAVLKARFTTFVVITLIPVLVLLAGLAAMLFSFGAMLPDLVAASTGAQPSPGPLAGFLISAFVVVIIQPLISLKATAMMTVGTFETAQGQLPTVASLWRSTQGFVRRILPLVLLFALLMVLLAVVLVIVVFATALVAAGSGQADKGAGALVSILSLLIVVAIPISIYFSVKLLYLVPVIGIEKARSFSGLARAWSMTRGAFWRTFAYYLMATLLVQGVTGLVSSLVQDRMVAALGGMPQPATLAELQATFSVLLPAYLISLAAQSLVQIMATPFQNSYTTVMYLDQSRRLEPPTLPPMSATAASELPASAPTFAPPPPPMPPTPPANPPAERPDTFLPGGQG